MISFFSPCRYYVFLLSLFFVFVDDDIRLRKCMMSKILLYNHTLITWDLCTSQEALVWCEKEENTERKIW